MNNNEYIYADFTAPYEEYSQETNEEFNTNECRMIGDSDLDIRSSSIRSGIGYVLCFEIIKNSKKPCLRYRLEKNTQTLVFETIQLDKGMLPNIEQAKYMGVYEYENTQYCFFLKQEEEYVVSEISNNNKHFYLMVHDIVNLKRHFGFTVANAVAEFFIKNEQFIFLEDENNRLIETPITGYKGDFFRKISIMAGLGVSRSGPYASLGPYYYFGSYDRSLRYAAITMNGKPLDIIGEKLTVGDTPVYTKGGLVKYALFMGSTKVMLNLPSDPKDTSFESEKLASERKFIFDSLRIRDTNGAWTDQFDSVIQPELIMYDRDLNIERTLDPQFVLKSYDQQLPLEYAYYKTAHITKDLSTGFYNIKDIVML